MIYFITKLALFGSNFHRLGSDLKGMLGSNQKHSIFYPLGENDYDPAS
jgi:hypothetical protein